MGSYFDTLSNGHFIWGGSKDYKYFLQECDSNQNIIWSKQYTSSPAPNNPNREDCRITKDKNGNYFFYFDKNRVGLLSSTGNYITAKQLGPYIQNDYEVINIALLDNNQKIILIKNPFPFSDGSYILLCLSEDLSTIVWEKYIYQYDLYLNSLNVFNNKVYITGNLFGSDGIIIELDNTGNIVKKNSYTDPDNLSSISIIALYKYANGFVAQTRAGSGDLHGYLRLDNGLNLISQTVLYGLSNFNNLILSVDQNGSFYAVSGDIYILGIGATFCEYFSMSNTDTLTWHKYAFQGYNNYPINIINSNKGLNILATGNSIPPGNLPSTAAAVFYQLNKSSNVKNCETGVPNFITFQPNYTFGASTIYASDTAVINLSNVSLSFSNFSLLPTTVCISRDTCSALKIVGDTNICSGNSQTFIGRRNQGCRNTINWSVTGGSVILQALNDSTVSVSFDHSGDITLIANLNSPCSSIYDSVKLHVTLPANNSLDLGADGYICPGNIILLNAHEGFASYLWQDGTVDSILSVSQPGIYYVTAINTCGEVLSDTVHISPHSNIPFVLGLDTTICKGQPTNIVAPGGFANYQWSPNYNISNLNTQSVDVYPLVDTLYKVRAEYSPNCYVYDSINVFVKPSPAINLGSDTSLCSGDTLSLDAGPGLNQYLWNNGEFTQQVHLVAIGNYSVIGTAANGCKGYDSLKILSIYPLPVVQLGNDSILCIGSDRILDAGNYTQYLWNTGSTARKLIVSSTGLYSVSVVDNNHCKGKGEINISKLIDPPKNFLPSDTTLCTYFNTILSPKSIYQSYLWNDNSMNSFLKISEPGQYWLIVKDINNCAGKDSINIKPKDCIKGFYIPTAFTPNGDTWNDKFKPYIFGNIQAYEFYIYNRFGKLIYKSTDVNTGWDGSYLGSAQNSGTYVWFCIYNLIGENKISKKGNVLLIR